MPDADAFADAEAVLRGRVLRLAVPLSPVS